jgi:hypothetical protein
MALELKQSLKMSQRIIMTPQLQHHSRNIGLKSKEVQLVLANSFFVCKKRRQLCEIYIQGQGQKWPSFFINNPIYSIGPTFTYCYLCC